MNPEGLHRDMRDLQGGFLQKIFEAGRTAREILYFLYVNVRMIVAMLGYCSQLSQR